MTEIEFEHFDPEYELGNLDLNGKRIKPRKRPGRKPNPPSPAQRKAQNRAAQKAFRERKQKEMKEAEMTIKKCMQMRDQALKQVKILEKKVQELRYENNYLKGQVLTFKITCVANAIDVPKYWDTGMRDKMGSDINTTSRTKDIPQSLEFFLDKNKQIITMTNEEAISYETNYINPLLAQPLDPSLTQHFLQTDMIKDSELWLNNSNELTPEIRSILNKNDTDLAQHLHSMHLEPMPSFKPEIPKEKAFWENFKNAIITDKIYVQGPLTPLDAVTRMRNMKDQNDNQYLLTPTELQRLVPHDPRIDLIPGPVMRDYMILFQDYYDANEVFNLLLESAIFIGGELGNPDCWYVPPLFIRKYWYLIPTYRQIRADNTVELTVFFAQKMIKGLKQRKEMYIKRDQYPHSFPEPNINTKQEQKPVENDARIDVLVINNINKNLPRMTSPNVFTV